MEDKDNNVIKLETTPRYKKKEVTYHDGKTIRSHVFIIRKGRLFHIEDTPYSAFFFTRKIINLEIETKLQTYARFIVPFLNYIFIDADSRISTISELTPQLANEFMDKFAYGYIGTYTDTKAKSTVKIAERSLTTFLKWLYYNQDKNLKLKYFKRDMFKHMSVFTIQQPPNKPKRKRLQDLSAYTVFQLIKIAEEHDPMMAFPITLQAFCGLRRGDICQLKSERFSWVCGSWDFIQDKSLLDEVKTSSITPISAYIELEAKEQMRRDATRTSGIKILRRHPIHEGLLPIVKDMYDRHIILLNEKGITNRYDAIIIDNWNHAMTGQTYGKRLDKLVVLLTKRLEVLSQHNKDALEAYLLVQKAPLKSHSLRYFFTNLIGSYVRTPNLLMLYRGDSNINSALGYLARTSTTREEIRAIQDSFIESFKEFFGDR